jgi:hypothetical protein
VRAGVAWLVWACVVGSCNREPSSLGSVQLGEFRALVYASDFAERFRLPAESAVHLAPGVLGIAVQVQDRAEAPDCSILLYLDDSVPFAYPPGQDARIEDLRLQTGPLFFANRMNDADANALMKRVGDLRIVYQSREYGTGRKRGVMQGGAVSGFWRALLPNLNVVRFDVTCDVLAPDESPVDVWLLRDGHDSSEMPAMPNEAVAIRVPIPDSLLRESAPATKRAAGRPIDVRPVVPPVFSIPQPSGPVTSRK